MTLTQINKAGLDELALDHVFTIGASGSDHYTFQGEGLNGTVNDPTLYLTRGKTYRFENGTGAHAIRIQSADDGTSGTLYNTGVTNNNTTGTVIVEVQHDAPDVLYYQCASHANMKGIIYVTGALADGGVTTAKLANQAVNASKIADGTITDSKLAGSTITSASIANTTILRGKMANNSVGTTEIMDDAVTQAKIAAGAVNTPEIATNAVNSDKLANNSVGALQLQSLAVTSNKITSGAINNTHIGTGAINGDRLTDETVTLAKLPHGDGSSDGKFLRANNGADPSFETVSIPAGTTINGNSDHRIVTATGTANTLQGESTFTHNPSTFDTTILHSTNTSNDLIIQNDSTGTAAGARFTLQSGSNANTGPQEQFIVGSHSWLRQVPKSSGNMTLAKNGVTHTTFDANGHISISDGNLNISTSGHGIDFSATANAGNSATMQNELLDDYEEGLWVPTISAGSCTFYSHQWYTKIGRVVTAYFYMYAFSDTSSSTHVRIGGLPYANDNARESSFSVTTGGNPSLGSGSTGVYGRIGVTGTTTQISFYRGFATTTANLTHAELNSGHYYATFQYITNA